MTYENVTNRASTGVATKLFSQICAREGAETRSNGYRYRSTRNEILIRIFTNDANWAFTSVARTSER